MNEAIKKKFVEFYELQSNAVFRFCLTRTSDRQVAIDLTQEAFMKYWKICQTESIEHERALIFKITRNLIIDWYRKSKSESLDKMVEEDVTGELDIPDASFENEQAQIEGRFALSAVKELNPEYRDIILMRFVDGMKPQEIAEVMSLGVNAVSVRLTRALESLRKVLKIP